MYAEHKVGTVIALFLTTSRKQLFSKNLIGVLLYYTN